MTCKINTANFMGVNRILHLLLTLLLLRAATFYLHIMGGF